MYQTFGEFLDAFKANPEEVRTTLPPDVFVRLFGTATDHEVLEFLSLIGDEGVGMGVKLVAQLPLPTLVPGHEDAHNLDLLLDTADRICSCVFFVALCGGANSASTYRQVGHLIDWCNGLKGTVLSIPLPAGMPAADWEKRLGQLADTLTSGVRLTGKDDCEAWRQRYAADVEQVRAVRQKLAPPPGSYSPHTAGVGLRFCEQRGPWRDAHAAAPLADAARENEPSGGPSSAEPSSQASVGPAGPPQSNEPAWLIVAVLQAAKSFDELSRKKLKELAPILNAGRSGGYSARNISRVMSDTFISRSTTVTPPAR